MLTVTKKKLTPTTLNLLDSSQRLFPVGSAVPSDSTVLAKGRQNPGTSSPSASAAEVGPWHRPQLPPPTAQAEFPVDVMRILSKSLTGTQITYWE